jgi:hypothetical protein
LTEELRKLGAFVGKWKGRCQVASTPYNSNGGLNRSTVVGRYALEDAFVFVDEVMEQEGRVTFRSHKVFGYDPRREVVTLHFFDSAGANPPSRAEGGWTEHSLILEQQTPFGLVRYVYSFEGDTYRHQTCVSEDGRAWSDFIEAAYEPWS